MESEITKEILLAASKLGWRLFRNNTGMGWTGLYKRLPMPYSAIVNPSDVLIRNARPLHAGLCKGSSDLIGWKPVVITQEMVGKTVAVFTGIEVKNGNTPTTLDQKRFIENIELAGGHGRIVNSVGEIR